MMDFFCFGSKYRGERTGLESDCEQIVSQSMLNITKNFLNTTTTVTSRPS